MDQELLTLIFILYFFGSLFFGLLSYGDFYFADRMYWWSIVMFWPLFLLLGAFYSAWEQNVLEYRDGMVGRSGKDDYGSK